MKLRYVMLGIFLAGTAAASTPADYAQQWPVNAQGEGAYAINLNEETYRIIQKNDLSDLAAFNAAGEALPFGPMPTSYGPLPAVWVQAKTFSLPKEASQNPDLLRLHVQRSAAGDLSLDANFTEQATVMQSHDWIIDVAEDDQAIEALQVQLSEKSGDFNAALVVQASNDLQQWQHLSTAAIVSLNQGGQSLQRLQIELPGNSEISACAKSGCSGRPAGIGLQAEATTLRHFKVAAFANPASELSEKRWSRICL